MTTVPGDKRQCGRRDSNPHERLSSADFLTGYGFRRPGELAGFAVWTIRSPCPAEPGLGAARLVSTPSPLDGSGRAWLGIAMCQGAPNSASSASPVSQRALKFPSSPLRLPFRHARASSADETPEV